jgi:hypothetical protein
VRTNTLADAIDFALRRNPWLAHLL